MRARTLLFGMLFLAGCSNSDLEDRVKKLEDSNKKYAEALEALRQSYEAQKAEAAAKAEDREKKSLDPDGIWAVDIADDLKAGQIEGPPTAAVTIVEAWDFG